MIIFAVIHKNTPIMLQRIQTLYLLIAEVLTIVLFFTNISTFLTQEGQELILKYNGLFQVVDGKMSRIVSTWPMAALLIAATVVGFFVIFLYRHRILQIRLCFFQMVMNFGLLVLFAYYIYSVSVVGSSNFKFSVVDILPLLSIILYYLAYRGVAKDLALVMADSFRTRRKR